jgi:hypothetical protein
METEKITLSAAARKFMQQRGINDVTFDLFPADDAGIINEIEPAYRVPADASGYRYFKVEAFHIFISREIKILGPLKLTTHGIWKMKRLFLEGAFGAVPFWILDNP